jgi:hypothetical protein
MRYARNRIASLSSFRPLSDALKASILSAGDRILNSEVTPKVLPARLTTSNPSLAILNGRSRTTTPDFRLSIEIESGKSAC